MPIAAKLTPKLNVSNQKLTKVKVVSPSCWDVILGQCDTLFSGNIGIFLISHKEYNNMQKVGMWERACTVGGSGQVIYNNSLLGM